MGGSNFDVLMQAIFKHRRIMEQLEEENRELRRQIADLREGHGISIEICGKRFPLTAELTTASAQPIPTPTPLSYNMPASTVSVLTPTSQQATILYEAEPDVTEAPTIAMPQTPSSSATDLTEEEEESIPTFLEEIMIDEFAAASTAATSPMSVWSPPTKKQQNTDEDEKATLRRQLIGSFLLE